MFHYCCILVSQLLTYIVCLFTGVGVGFTSALISFFINNSCTMFPFKKAFIGRLYCETLIVNTFLSMQGWILTSE